MRYDLLIRNGSVVRDDSGTGDVVPADVAVADGKIVEVAPDLPGDAAETIDASGLHVLPAAVDPHVHFNDPGRADWEGWQTGSNAAAAGGTGCVFDMPLNASPPTLDAASFDLKVAAAAGRSRVDFALWGGLTPGNLDRMGELAGRGVVGFKAFMSSSGVGDFERADDDALLDGMTRAAALGLPVAVHAEDEATCARLTAEAKRDGRRGVADYLASRPVAAEVAAVRRALAMAREAGCGLHVVHVSSPEAADVLATAAARRRDAAVSFEVCPHHLLLDDADAARLGVAAKCAPPLRPADAVAGLWGRLSAGDVDWVASDHSPAPASMKRYDPADPTCDDFFAAWGGVAGVQSLLPSLLAFGPARGLSMPDVARLTSRAAARRFRLAGKGRVAPGYDADLALVDVAAARPLERSDLLDRHKLSPFVGLPVGGMVARTLVRGRTVFAGGRVVGGSGGRLVRPAPRPA